ncbi:hypothetical protein MS2017_0026 [Bathymodiolus thermophilus thioautotrophic gill symbiont]|uniref:Histidine kinase domain-containing protein n=1 Tax=Bathymodiolus thermophilus thioautotrophic gill symbiont TaxID=2360 RepID=A0A3G3IIX8_9GAMM|nr:ATP-binding protein [Bathymodiolus thermophilus thioautotrophic gill symbiont]AYQ55796.1 hypothetical protein MS2017_0026 [Bathymodiolus thermophilus thioautotrophic gill symbiont]
MKPKAFNFEFSPNLIALLGEQLIHDKKIAVSELVKNAYDADASKVEIEVINDQITIEDDGSGMDINTIKNVWLKPGISSKKNIQTGVLTPKYNRMPIGEKGVGRLGSHKLGSLITLYTKSDNQEIYLHIDWNELEKSASLSDMPPIDVLENKTNEIQGKSGTKIIIEQLKEKWADKDIEQLSCDLTNLIAPFSSQNNFNIILKKDNELFHNDLKEQAEKIKQNALFNFNITINNGFISKFNYQFKPWLGLDKVDARKISLPDDINLLKNTLGKKQKVLDFDNELEIYEGLNIGEINFSGLIYDFDNILWGVQEQLNTKEKISTKNYIKFNGGIRVYRDNFRVFNYGEPGHDILNLDARRVQRTSGQISSNQILASIRLSRKESTGLIEKTNREGFVNNAALDGLNNALNEILRVVNIFRENDKQKIIKTYLSKPEDRVSIEGKVEDMRQTIVNSNLSEEAKEKITNKLQKFSKDFSEAKNIFMNAANAGVSLSIVVHELDKVISNLNSNIKDKNWAKVPEIAKYLQTTLDAYKDTLRVDKKTSIVGIDEIVNKSIFNVSARFAFHKIEVITDLTEDLSVPVKRNLIIGVLNNLFDNAIYWLDYQRIQNKKILIKSYEKDKQIHLLVADNGKGFTIDFDIAITAFITGRNDDSSMGIGLHLADKIMEAHEGLLTEGNLEAGDLPKEFKDGAIVKLIFRK